MSTGDGNPALLPSPPTPASSEEQTVKVLIVDDAGKVLLVRERGKQYDSYEQPEGADVWKKLPRWGAPGGKVEGTVQEILDGIYREFRRLGMDANSVAVRRALKRCRKLGDPRVVLTAVKEVLEETGMFAVPFAMGLWVRGTRNRDTVWLIRSRLALVGRTGAGDAQIVAMSWFDARYLPRQTYRRTRAMVRRALLRPEGESK